jgi:zinc protease
MIEKPTSDLHCAERSRLGLRPLVLILVAAILSGVPMLDFPTQVRAATISLPDGLSDVAEFQLDNGMQIVVIPDNRVPVVTHMVWYRVGAADEPPGKSGIAHFLEHLMFKGTETIAPGEFSKTIARWGGQDNAFTSQDVTAYFQRIAKERLEDVMRMEADRMVNLRLAPEDVATERDVILEERSTVVDNSPSSILQEQMQAALYVAHPYGNPVIGWEPEMRGLEREDALLFYERFYAPNNAVLVVAGDVAPEDVRAMAERVYGPIARRDDVGMQPRPVEPEPRAARRVLLRDARAGKPSLYRYYLTPSYMTAEGLEAEALDLLMRILGNSETGRLYNALVVEQKIADAAGGWYGGSSRDYGRTGVYAIAADGTDLDTVEAAIDAVILDVAENGISEDELACARNAELADFIYRHDSQSALARTYGFVLATGGTVDDVARYPERLAMVSAQDVQSVAQKFLKDERSVTGLLIPVPGQASARARAQEASPITEEITNVR